MEETMYLMAKDERPKVEHRTHKIETGQSLAVCLLPLALCLLLSGCNNEVGPAAVSRQTVEGVTISEVHPSEVEEYFETSGTIRAKTISRIAGRTMGTVTSLLVKEGDRVRAGQVLLTVDDRDEVQKVIAAEKTL